MPSPMSDAEIAEDRYEQIHGAIDYWSYGVQSARIPGEPIRPLPLHIAHDVPSRADALDGLDKLAQDSTVGTDAQWEAFADRVQAERERTRDLSDPEDTGAFELTGPDGLLYWVEAIDRS